MIEQLREEYAKLRFEARQNGFRGSFSLSCCKIAGFVPQSPREWIDAAEQLASWALDVARAQEAIDAAEEKAERASIPAFSDNPTN